MSLHTRITIDTHKCDVAIITNMVHYANECILAQIMWKEKANLWRILASLAVDMPYYDGYLSALKTLSGGMPSWMHARSSFSKKATSRAKEPLQLIHTDLCGPITLPSHAFEAFKKFKDMVEKEKGLKIKSMRSDRGREFLSNEFNKFCVDNEIQIFLTAPYSPQQNGVVERKNRTILNMVRSMLKSKKMPKEFWAEVVDCAPTVSHLRIFGSIAYVYVLSQRRSKLDDRSEKHVFVGSDKQSKGYKLYNPVTRKVVVSRDVEFEEGLWDWSIKENERYDFLPMTDEEEIGESGDEVQQPESPTLTPTQDSPLSSSEGEPKTRSFQELYEVTNEILLLCLYADCEPLVFEEAMKIKKWRQAMEEEIKSIEKHDTWELTTLPKGQKAIGVKWIYKAKKKSQRRSREVQGKTHCKR
ncbi:retrovirus-related pol polyprotein from transposon TNT 1-94 [Tanacetum coccineum]